MTHLLVSALESSGVLFLLLPDEVDHDLHVLLIVDLPMPCASVWVQNLVTLDAHFKIVPVHLMTGAISSGTCGPKGTTIIMVQFSVIGNLGGSNSSFAQNKPG